MGIIYRPEIDGMRAIAVLAVVLYHGGVGPGAGFVGVDVFFVISGYLITSLLIAEWMQKGQIGFLDFYARRARRIVPAALLVVSATMLASWALLHPAAMIDALNSAAAASVFLSNLFFQEVTGGYFDVSSEEMPLLHLWSLSVEEQFYVLWPALVLMVLRRWPRALALVLASIAFMSFSLAEYLMRHNPEAAFYQTPARFWELCCGGLIATFRRRAISIPWLASIVVGGLLLSTMHIVGDFPGLGALPAVILSAALLWLIHSGSDLGIVGLWLRSGPMVAIGRISYSFYLWHWPLLALYTATTIGVGSALTRVSLCGLALTLAFVSYRYVEQPLRRLKSKPGATVVVAIGVSLVLGATALTGASLIREREESRPRDNPFAARVESDLPHAWRRCHYQVGSVEFPRAGCESIPGVPPKVVMWGDSMALAWKPLAWELGKSRGVSAVDYSRDGCPPVLDYIPPNPKPGDFKCRDFNARVIETLNPSQTIVLVMRLGDGWNQDRLTRLSSTIEALSHRVEKVYVLGPTPELPESVPRCIRANQTEKCILAKREFDKIASPQLRLLRATTRDIPNVTVVDVSPYFCNAKLCPAVMNGIGLYWDDHHVSATAAGDIAQRLVPELESKSSNSPR